MPTYDRIDQLIAAIPTCLVAKHSEVVTPSLAGARLSY
jgi:hypothetical protein